MNWVIEKLKNNFQIDNESLCLRIDGYDYTYSGITMIVAGIQKTLINKTNADIIGIVATDSPLTYASILACWFSGKGFVPIHPKYPVDRNNDIIKQANIDLVLSSIKECDEFISSAGTQIVHTENLPEKCDEIEILPCKDETVFCILFTSGSTGKPKGVPLSLKNIESTLDAFFALGYKLDKNDRFLQMFELTFDLSMMSYLPSFILGASIYTVGHEKIRYIEALKIIKDHKITFAIMVPSTLSLLRPYFSKIMLPDMKYSLLGGEPFSSDLAEEWRKCVPNATIVNVSGPAEITMLCMGYELEKDTQKYRSYNGILGFGFPWKNTKAIVVDEKLEIVDAGRTGELCFAGDHVMSGYLKMPDLNNIAFFEKNIGDKSYRFYRSGDMAFTDSSGFFYTCGRKDLQVKIQGHKIELEEIEFVAKKLLNNNMIVVLATMNPNGTHELKMVIQGTEINKEEIINTLRKKLPPYMIPTQVEFIENFLYNTNGKIDRIALKKLFQ